MRWPLRIRLALEVLFGAEPPEPVPPAAEPARLEAVELWGGRSLPAPEAVAALVERLNSPREP